MRIGWVGNGAKSSPFGCMKCFCFWGAVYQTLSDTLHPSAWSTSRGGAMGDFACVLYLVIIVVGMFIAK